MNGTDPRIVGLLQEARRQLEAEREKRCGPIAVVGIGCRFPGNASSPEGLWHLLRAGVDATGDVPLERWDADQLYDPDPDSPGKAYVRRAAFLAGIEGFDAEFFGISPREAAAMDPQQRLLLEVVWEALEDAGMPPSLLRGSATGVWVGSCLDDYARHTVTSGDVSRIDAYSALGNTRSVAAGRIAYVLDLHGPAIQLDTACSSSLVAVHQACNSLRSGETDLALAGGVSLMLSPETTIALCKLRALAKDGRCKTFDASADGYGRGEGCGIVVLKRLADARAAGDRIYAVVRGSAVNHDGHSNGLTAPNAAAQEAVIRSALSNGGVDASAVDYVEVHGTGTLLGDPIEVLALNRVYGQARHAQHPLYLGSVKTNFGHLEAAAGIAGFIKAALCVAKGEIPRHLHLKEPNPKIPWAKLAVEIATENVDWPRNGARRFAGVSSFGISGTNAHVVLEEAPPSERPRSAPARSAELVVLSAKTPEALSAAAARLLQHLDSHREIALRDLAYSLAATRSSMDQRWAEAVSTREMLTEALKAAAKGGKPAAPAPKEPATKVVFVFPGQGSQWLGMGRGLLAEEPIFREALEACDRAIMTETGWSVLGELNASVESSRLARVDVVQPVLFALQIALAALWRSWGVEPEAVVGHSMGEVAAACVAGALSLEAGAAVICRRSKLLRRISGQGEMALVELSIAEAEAELMGHEDRVSVAVSNGTSSTVLSGEPQAVRSIVSRLDARGIFCRLVQVDVASHSPQVDPLLKELQALLADVAPRATQLAMHSTVTGHLIEGAELNARYWAENLRQPVRFGSVVQSLLRQGPVHFIEVSPHPVLVTAIDQLQSELRSPGTAVGSLRREQPELLTMLRYLGVLHVHGYPLDAPRLFSTGARPIPLPTYPWQRKRHWIEAPRPIPHGARSSLLPSEGTADKAAADAPYRMEWRAAEASTGPRPLAHRWVIVALGTASDEEAFANSLRARGLRCDVVPLRELAQTPPAEYVICVWRNADSVGPTELANAGLAIIQALAGREDAPRLCWVTFRAMAVAPGDDVTLAASVLWGLGRTVAQEHPELEFTLLDLEGEDQLHRAVVSEMGVRDGENQVAWRGERRHVLRLARAMPLLPVSADGNYQVTLGALEESESPVMAPAARPRPAAGEVEIEVRCAGVNFRDALAARRTLDSVALGHECAGVVTALGAGVSNLRVGDAVLALARGTFARFVCADARLVKPLPRNVSEMQAATIPVAFLTAWYALHDLAALKPGERVLVHAAAGGVGLAAMQLARRIGAEVVATASPEKWPLVRSRGATQVANSRDVSFAQDFKALAGAIDVVLNGLAGDFVDASLSLLGPGSRFIELGKTDVRDPTQLARSNPGIAYHSFDLGDVNVVRLAEILDSVCQALESGHLQPLPVRTWPVTEVASALRVMAHGHHTGKLALLPLATKPFPRDGSVLVTGGLGALGLEVAHALVNHGATRLVLLGRRGVNSPEAKQAVAELQARGASVSIVEADVADREALRESLAAIPREHPLRGVVHAAGVLRDGLLTGQTPERFREVLAPKVDGAWNLHLLTQGADLEFFVLFSSLAGALGSAGQGAYSAANAFLDALAAHRQARGLPATSVAWGPWSGRGLATLGRASAGSLFHGRGVGPIQPEEGRAAFQMILHRPEAHVILARLHLDQVAQAFHDSVPSVWRELLRGAPHSAAAEGPKEERLADALERLAAVERPAHLRQWLAEQCAALLGYANASSMDLQRGFFDLGMDSLMILQLRQRLERGLGRRISPSVAFAHPTIAALADYLVEGPAVAEPAAPPPPSTSEPSSVRPEVEVLETDEEVLDFINSRFESET